VESHPDSRIPIRHSGSQQDCCWVGNIPDPSMQARGRHPEPFPIPGNIFQNGGFFDPHPGIRASIVQLVLCSLAISGKTIQVHHVQALFSQVGCKRQKPDGLRKMVKRGKIDDPRPNDPDSFSCFHVQLVYSYIHSMKPFCGPACFPSFRFIDPAPSVANGW